MKAYLKHLSKTTGREIRILLVLATLAGAAQAQFDAYTWEFKHGLYGGGQTWVQGDRLFIQLDPACAFGDLDSGYAQTTVLETGRFTFDYSASSLACPALGGACINALLATVTGSCSCPVYSSSSSPDCEFQEVLFNDGVPYFTGAQSSLSGQWSVDVIGGECFRIAATTGGLSLDCQILATYANLVFTPALAASSDQFSLGAGGPVGLQLSAPTKFAGAPFLVLGSASGTQPGVPIDGLVMPLNIDAYLLHTLSHPSGPPITGGFGTLDENGLASASFDLSTGASPSLVGLQLHHAAGVFDVTSSPGNPFVGFVSNAASLTLVP